jgi:hypothetical protein
MSSSSSHSKKSQSNGASGTLSGRAKGWSGMCFLPVYVPDMCLWFLVAQPKVWLPNFSPISQTSRLRYYRGPHTLMHRQISASLTRVCQIRAIGMERRDESTYTECVIYDYAALFRCADCLITFQTVSFICHYRLHHINDLIPIPVTLITIFSYRWAHAYCRRAYNPVINIPPLPCTRSYYPTFLACNDLGSISCILTCVFLGHFWSINLVPICIWFPNPTSGTSCLYNIVEWYLSSMYTHRPYSTRLVNAWMFRTVWAQRYVEHFCHPDLLLRPAKKIHRMFKSRE